MDTVKKKEKAELMKELKDIHSTILTCAHDEVKLEKAIRRLEKIVIFTNFTKQEERVLQKIFGEDLYQYYDKYFFEPTVAFEQHLRQKTLQEKKVDLRHIKKKTLLYSPDFPKLVKEEVLSAMLSKDDLIAYVGSGPFPLSAILYHRYSGATVHCIEKDEQSCIESRALLKELGLDNKIFVIHTRGEKMVNQGYTFVSVASQAYPRETVLKHLQKILQPKTKMLLRAQCGAGVIFYNSENSVSESVLSRFTLLKKIPRADHTMMALLYEVT